MAVLTTFVDASYESTHHTEANTSHLVVDFVEKVFTRLERYSDPKFSCSILLNSTEPQGLTSSRADRPRLRPGTMVAVNKCTLLIGEDRFDELQLAKDNLKNKRQDLTPAHYGQLRFLLAYAAAGTQFQWFWMSSDGIKVSTYTGICICSDLASWPSASMTIFCPLESCVQL